MIPTKQLIVEFDLRFDRFASEFKKNLRLEDKLSVLNEAHDKIFENLVKLVEVNSKFRNDLIPFEVKDYSLQLQKEEKEYTIFSIPSDHYKRLRINCTAFTKECGEKRIPVTIFQTDDLEIALKDSFWQPSYEWETVLGDEGAKGVFLYHNGKFSITECRIDYIRKPKGPLQCASMSKKGYYRDSRDILINYDTDSEFDTTFKWHDIVDLAVLIGRANIGDTRDMRIQREKILIKEQTT